MNPTVLTEEQKQALREKVALYQQTPEVFCSEILGIDSYWDKQRDILKAIAKHKKVTVRSGHDVGKSFVAADVVLWFLTCYTPSIVITTAPTWRQVERVLWGEIHQHYIKSKAYLGGQLLQTELNHGPKWYAAGFSSDKPDAFQGFHERNVLVIVDEASGVEDITFEQIESILSNQNARLLLIGNPTRATGYFAESFSDPTFHKIHVSCLESPNVKAGKVLYPSLVTKEWCDEKLEKWGKDSPFYQARVLGNIPKESEDVLIKMEWIQRSILRHEKATPQIGAKFEHLQYSVDVARKGKNKTVHIMRSGRRVLEIRVYQGYDCMQTVGAGRDMIERWGLPDNIIIDDNGVGGGVTDRWIELGYGDLVVAENAGAKAEDESKYVNRRSELADRVKEAFRLDELDIPDNEELAFECSNQYFDHTSDFKLRVMSKALLKKLVKKLTGKRDFDSPDYFDSLTLSYAKEIPSRLAKTKYVALNEFDDKVHIQSFPPFPIGVSRFNVLVQIPELNSAYNLWACADRKGLVYFYDEATVERATSEAVDQAIRDVERQQIKDTDLRYCENLNHSKEDEARYNLIEQLGDYEYFYEEVLYNPEMAIINLRAGLKFDKSQPVNNLNHPYIFFSPKCAQAIRAVKYYARLKTAKDNPLMEAVHKAVGLMILSEPLWLKTYNT